MKKRSYSFLFFCLICFCCKSQTAGFGYYADLDSVKTSGFYNIKLTPELNAHLKTDYSDLRIVNDSGKWVPHILTDLSKNTSCEWLTQELEIIKKEDNPFSSKIIARNKWKAISALTISARNTDASRSFSLTGSDDLINWFVISDSIRLDLSAAVEEKYQRSLKIKIPICDYKYFGININNSGKAPIDIISIAGIVPCGQFFHDDPGNPDLDNPTCSIFQKDSGKISYIRITQPEAYHFNHISLKVGGVKYFGRNVDLYIPENNSGSFSNPGTLIQSIAISNNSLLRFNLPTTNAVVFYLLIHNEDNPSLKVDAVITSADADAMITYLEKDLHYRLIMENPAAVIPHYDLKGPDFKNADSSISLGLSKIIPFTKSILPEAKARESRWLIWIAIGAALLILLVFTYRILKEVNTRKSNDHL
ncbi:MAG: hypothetical protein ABJA78_13975 [Ferruginibacter sp.]